MGQSCSVVVRTVIDDLMVEKRKANVSDVKMKPSFEEIRVNERSAHRLEKVLSRIQHP